MAKQTDKLQQEEASKFSPGVKAQSASSEQKSSCEQPMALFQIQRSRTGGKVSTESQQRLSGQPYTSQSTVSPGQQVPGPNGEQPEGGFIQNGLSSIRTH